jgi:uncharacterized protein (DUF885 family)
VNDFLIPLILGLGAVIPALARAEDSGARSRFNGLLSEAWEFRLAEDPIFATSVGDHRFDDRLPAAGIADEARRTEKFRDFRKRLLAIDASGLNEIDRESYALFQRELDDAISDFELHGYRFPINADSGFHIEFAQLPEDHPLATIRDYENYIARLRAFAARSGPEGIRRDDSGSHRGEP